MTIIMLFYPEDLCLNFCSYFRVTVVYTVFRYTLSCFLAGNDCIMVFCLWIMILLGIIYLFFIIQSKLNSSRVAFIDFNGFSPHKAMTILQRMTCFSVSVLLCFSFSYPTSSFPTESISEKGWRKVPQIVSLMPTLGAFEPECQYRWFVLQKYQPSSLNADPQRLWNSEYFASSQCHFACTGPWGEIPSRFAHRGSHSQL